MQRPNNAGGPGSGFWTADVRLGNNFPGQTRNLQHPTPSLAGREGMPVVPAIRYAIPSQQNNPFRPGWGQDQDSPSQQLAAANLWNSGGATGSGSNSDQARSFLGTEQWGMESGGAPWGTTHLEQSASTEANSSSSTAARTAESNVFGHHVSSDPWLVGSKTSVVQSNQDVTKQKDGGGGDGEGLQRQSAAPSEKDSPSEDKTNKSSNSPVTSSENTSSEKDKTSEENLQNPVDTSTTTSSEIISKSEDDKNDQSKGNSPTSLSANNPTSEDSNPVTESSTTQQTTTTDSQTSSTDAAASSSADSSVAGTTIDQLQQMSIMDTYMQQQNIAALTSYQLAVQQQYALAAQQQQLAPGGMFLPGSYIIPAQTNPATYDPNTAGQFPVMAHYSPYAGWPAATGVYPSVLQQQMAAVAAASVTSQPASSSPTTSQANRPSTQTPQSPPSQSPSLQQQQDSSQTQQSEILANVAAMQQNSLNQAMAMASYGIMPSAYYDQTGALIINNGRGAAPVRLFAPGPMLMNGSQSWIPPQVAAGNGSMFRYNPAAQPATAGTVYANQQSVSGGSTPAPSINQGFGAPPSGSFGSTGNVSNLEIGALSTGIGSNSSTPQRKDSFSDYSKHPQQPYGAMSQFYGSLGMSPNAGSGISGMSPSPGPLSNLMHGHGISSPPQSMSPSSMMLGSGSRMFSAAPGAEAKFRNGQYMSSIGSSGSSLFPPTRIRPAHMKDMMMTHGRSKLLDDFRNNRLTNPMLHELANHIVEFSQDQHGSRFIQQKLERATLQEKQQVFNEIIDSAYHLMTDVFGNYVIQKFFEFGSMEHKLALADHIHGHVLPLALQMYGCRVIQKALECIPQEKQVEIVKELDGHLLKCVKDQNGNHVVQKCIECVPPTHLQFIVDGFKGQVVGLSSHPYGCRVMQRILEHCTEEQTAPILEELHQHTEMLVKDQYGNYVIQHVLEHGRPENKHQMVNELRGKILALSQHKFASNVIEKCVSHSSPPNRAWLIEEVCQEPDALFIMMKDQYANYVVQKMLDVAEPQQKKLLIHKIRPHVLTLRKFTYGKHIITKLEKFFIKAQQGPAGTSTDIATSQLSGANWGLDTNE